MLTRFAIEPAAIVSSGSKTQDQEARIESRSRHKRLIQWWRSHGILIDPKKGPASVVSSLRNIDLDPGIRDLWSVAWKQMIDIRRIDSNGAGACDPISWSELESPYDFQSYRDMIELALVEPIRAAVLGLSDDGTSTQYYSVTCCGIDVTKLLAFDLSREYARIDTLRHKSIPSGQKREVIWQERFAKLARCGKRVSIVDRHALVNIGQNDNGFFSLLNLLDRDSQGCNITLYASSKAYHRSDVSIGHIDDQLKGKITKLNRKGVREVSVFLCPDSDFGKIYPDRFIRFDHCVCDIGHGLEVFSRPKTFRSNSFGFAASNVREKDALEIEKQLEKASRISIGDAFKYRPKVYV